MPMIARAGEALIRLGMGALVARMATFAYNLKPGGRRHFSFDDRRNWVNCQQDVTFVSPAVHTLRYAEVKAVAEDIWTFDYTPKPGDVVIDIGAGIGTESVVFARQVGPSGRVIAVEAHPATCEALRRTMTRSGLDNVKVVNVAIADHEGELLISDNADAHIGNSMLGVSKGVSVRATTLDTLVRDLDIDRIDYLKMNIEGAEGPAMKGAGRTIGAVRHVAIACHDFIADEGGSEETRTLALVRRFLKERGFVTRERPDDPRVWVRDQVYGRRVPAGTEALHG